MSGSTRFLRCSLCGGVLVIQGEREWHIASVNAPDGLPLESGRADLLSTCVPSSVQPGSQAVAALESEGLEG